MSMPLGKYDTNAMSSILHRSILKTNLFRTIKVYEI